MSLLFDITPDEPKKQRKAKAAPAPEPVLQEPAVTAVPAFVVSASIGVIDGHFECHRCGGQAHDILLESGKEWWVECCYCGLFSWERAVKGHLKPSAGDFVFADGRYAGKTVAQAAAEPNGIDYLTWAATNHKRPSVREVCRGHLDSLKAGR